MWKLTIEDDQANKTIVHLVRDDYAIGRSEENAIRLTERNISRSHARLERKAESWALKDLSSDNGCYVNGQRVSAPHELVHGDLIQVGDYRLIVENEALLGGPDASATLPVVPRSPSSPGLDRLIELAGPQAGAEYVLTQERMVVGRGEECDISINHPSVSRVHAELYPLGDGRYEIFDKNSANGVRVNGVELPRSFIDARDVLELGDVILKFIPAGEMYIPGVDDRLQLEAIGAARRQEAEEGQLSRFGGSFGIKLGIGIALAVLLAVAAFVKTRPSVQHLEIEQLQDTASEQENPVLTEAKRLGLSDPRAAYRKAAELPLGSSARETATFKAIQAAYADHLFALVERARESGEKRALLDEIVRSTSIDAGRRNRAAAALTELSTPSVDVSELPQVPSVAPRSASKGSSSHVAGRAEHERPSPTTTRTNKPASTKAAAKPSGVLVRQNPFDTEDE